MATFGLIHGAWHGAWCWEALGEQLRRRGHQVITPDLPFDRPSSWTECAEVAVAAFAQADVDLAVIGHSLGGLVVPLVADRTSTHHQIYLCAIQPVPDQSIADWAGDHPDMFIPGFGSDVATDESGASWWPVGTATQWLYQDCGVDLAAWAEERLMRHHTLWFDRLPVRSIPSSEISCIVGRQDRSINPEWSRRVSPERLGVKSVEIESGHSPFLSCPSDLADLVCRLTEH